MRTLNKTLISIALVGGSLLSAEAQKYTDGVLILNEDWFGHNNSTLNFLNTKNGEFDYMIIQNANDDEKLSLGCTAQFGTVYGGNIYIMSKQDQDPGEFAYTGGRVVVADANTMKIKKSIPVIARANNGRSMADGRAFVGVDESKGYVGTSNGIYIMDLGSFEVKNRIEGSENPFVTGNESNADGNGALYNNQIGMMIRTHDYVFAIQQDRGVLVIDAKTDKIIDVIEGCFSTMTQSKDGNIWVGVNSNMNEQKYPYGLIGEEWVGNQLLKINPETLETKSINISQGGVNQTWYAWTAGSLCASAHENALYFTFNSNVWSWFTSSEMYKYDIDNDAFTKIFDSADDQRYFYGGGIRINPLDDKIYATLYRDNNDQSYWIYEMDNIGNVLNEYEPIQRYWFTALPIFPDKYAPTVSDFEALTISNATPVHIDLSAMAHDQDNLDAAITKRVVAIDDEDIVAATIKSNSLTIIGNTNQQGVANITVRFNSNGKFVDKTLTVNVSTLTGIEENAQDAISVYAEGSTIYVENITTETRIQVYTIQGQLIQSQTVANKTIISDLPSQGIYIVKIGNKSYKVVIQ